MKNKSRKIRQALSLTDRIAVIEAFQNNFESKHSLARRYKCSLGQIRNTIQRKKQYLLEWENKGKPIMLTLALAERIAVIEEYQNNIESKRNLAKKYNCSLGHIKSIIQRKNEYLLEWENNGNANPLIKKPSACFLSVGAVVCEFAHRWIRQGLDISDEILCAKSQEAANLLGTLDIQTTTNWLERLKFEFKIFHPPDITAKKTLEIENIIRELMPSYLSETKCPQHLDQNVVKLYLREPTDHNTSKVGSTSAADILDCKYFYTPESNTTTYTQSTDGSVSEEEIDIVDIKMEEDDNILISTKTKPNCQEKQINSYEEALRHLALLGEFVLLKEDVKATGLIDQLENLFKRNIENNV